MAQLWRHLADPRLGEEVREFTRESVIPVADEIDRTDRYPSELVAATAERGWNSLVLPPRYGGGGRPLVDLLCVFEELSVGSAALGVSLITIFQSQRIIEAYGSESLKERILPRYATGLRASYALTEAGHGSDIRTLDTTARRSDKGGWVINGEKSFVTSGSAADLFIVAAQAPEGVSIFAVPREAPGVGFRETPAAATFGLRNGPHVDLILESVELPADALIGEPGMGLKQAMATLARSRVLAAGISLGIARAAIEGALRHATSREAFGSKVFDFQGVQWYFSDLVAELDAARLLAYQAARDLDEGYDVVRSSSAAKLVASRLATRAAEMAVQVCGAHGVRMTSPYGRYLRDAKAYEVAGGSSEVLKNSIGKALRLAVERATRPESGPREGGTASDR
jgi:alkylation response protein AidB-like acyl-CoA dehydrogenase